MNFELMKVSKNDEEAVNVPSPCSLIRSQPPPLRHCRVTRFASGIRARLWLGSLRKDQALW
jgi:hypothetical protein